MLFLAKLTFRSIVVFQAIIVLAMILMFHQIFLQMSFITSLVVIFAKVFYTFNHSEKNRTNIYKFSILGVTIRAISVLSCPILYTFAAKQLIVATIAFNRLSIFSDNLIANTTNYVILHILDVFVIHNPRICQKLGPIKRLHCHLTF